MRGKKLWVQFWTEKQKQRKRNNDTKGLNFLMSYEMTYPKNVLKELQAGLEVTMAGKWGSGYVVIMPDVRRKEELIRNRLATHPFELSEWPGHEIDGLPNRRYSIFIYNEHTCPQFASLPETDWRMEYSEGIPIYEKGFNVAYLKRTFPKLKRILISIYQGGTPQPTVLKPMTTESKTNNNMKQTKKITESQLRAIVAESVKKVLNENKPYWGNEVYPTPYQSIIDKILPVWKELHSKCDFDDGMELSQEEANVLGAANHLSKAMDLLRYPQDRR